jgi:flagella basal body P-ring formation protein FlgA
MRQIGLAVTLVLALLWARPGVGQTVITLRPVARVPSAETVTLAHLADIGGTPSLGQPLGVSLAGVRVPITPDAAGRATVGLDLVRDSIQAAGLDPGPIIIRGQTCTVMIRQAPTPSGTPPTTPTAQPVPSGPDPLSRTIGEHIRFRIEQTLGVAGTDLELIFDEADAALLAEHARGRPVEVRCTGFSRRTPVRVLIYNPDGTIQESALRVGVRVRRETARLLRDAQRGQTLGPHDLQIEHGWTDADAGLAEPAQALGQVLKRALRAGEVITRGHLESPVSIERGDVVIAHAAAGSVVIRREARALESARAGERIRLKPLAGGNEFSGVVEGPGRVVMLVREPSEGEPLGGAR